MKKIAQWVICVLVIFIFMPKIFLLIAETDQNSTSVTGQVIETIRTPSILRANDLVRLTGIDETRAIYAMLLASTEACGIDSTHEEIGRWMSTWVYLSDFRILFKDIDMTLQPTFNEILEHELSPRGEMLTRIRIRSLKETDGCKVSQELIASIKKLK